MLHMLFLLEPGESVIWEGRRRPPNTSLGLVGSVILLGLSLILIATGYVTTTTVGFIAWGLILLTFSLTLPRLNNRIRLCITNRRIVKTVDVYWWSRTWKIPLESVIDIVPKHIRGKAFISFVPSTGQSRIVFGPLKDDPDRIREIALHARSSLLKSDK